jgi:hypothetical protein
MPKKTRRMKERAAIRRGGGIVTSSQEIEETAGVSSTVASTSPRFSLSSSRVVTPLTYDYSHIYNDLKRIALFASFFFVVLVVLAFVIK